MCVCVCVRACVRARLGTVRKISDLSTVELLVTFFRFRHTARGQGR